MLEDRFPLNGVMHAPESLVFTNNGEGIDACRQKKQFTRHNIATTTSYLQMHTESIDDGSSKGRTPDMYAGAQLGRGAHHNLHGGVVAPFS